MQWQHVTSQAHTPMPAVVIDDVYAGALIKSHARPAAAQPATAAHGIAQSLADAESNQSQGP